jgi:mRNA interferase MazF
MSHAAPNPKRGEIWRINLDPTVGAEIMKCRPAVVVSSDALNALPLKIIVPITNWNPNWEGSLRHVQLHPSAQSGLSKISAADAFQVRSVSLERFAGRMGKLTATELEEVCLALAAVVELR